MGIELTPEQQAIIESRVNAGFYKSPAAMIDQALDVLEEKEHRLAKERAFFEREIKPAWEAAARGETTPLDMNEIRAELRSDWEARGLPR